MRTAAHEDDQYAFSEGMVRHSILQLQHRWLPFHLKFDELVDGGTVTVSNIKGKFGAAGVHTPAQDGLAQDEIIRVHGHDALVQLLDQNRYAYLGGPSKLRCAVEAFEALDLDRIGDDVTIIEALLENNLAAVHAAWHLAPSESSSLLSSPRSTVNR